MRFAILIALCLAAAATGVRADSIVATADGRRIDREELARRLAAADVAILGEVHDNPVHHANQAWLVGRLAPGGLAVEMLLMDDEGRISRHLAGGGAPDGIGPLVGWEKSGWPDWTLYAPIFAALPPGAVVAGAALPRERMRRIMSEDAAALVPDERFRPILSRPLPAKAQAALEAEMIEDHCGELPEEMAPMMVQGQRLRDASLAAAVLRARAAGAAKVAVITGDGHARTDRGVPVYLAEVAPDLKVLSLGQIEEGDAAALADAPFDFVWVTERHDRPDPCEQLRKRKDG